MGDDDAGCPNLDWRQGKKVVQVGFFGKMRDKESREPEQRDDEINENAQQKVYQASERAMEGRRVKNYRVHDGVYSSGQTRQHCAGDWQRTD
ncbi:MAG: hypothetical protein L6R41_007927 [Letrouitia leprolyta]|nr:MAG: hypothetical protein L6R41_007927 [Letrouitia leprolyta]